MRLASIITRPTKAPPVKLAFCSDQMNLSSLQGADDHLAIGRAAIAGARQRLSDLGAQLERVTAALIAEAMAEEALGGGFSYPPGRA